MVLIEPHGPRNVIQATAFDRDAPWFGYQGAVVTHLDLLDAANNPVDELVGGSNMTLRVSVHANQTIERALVGFQVRNEEGQHLFGENTHLAYRNAPFRVEAGQDFEAVFELRLPFLPAGRFTVVVAVCDGTQTDHLHHQWIDDALYFRVPESHVQRGLVGVPITRIDATSRPLTEQQPVSD
jgi:lipopolysaccharide transport system ATP-binding protein